MKALLAALCLTGCTINPWDEHLPFTEWNGSRSYWTPRGRVYVLPDGRRMRQAPTNPTPAEAARNLKEVEHLKERL